MQYIYVLAVVTACCRLNDFTDEFLTKERVQVLCSSGVDERLQPHLLEALRNRIKGRSIRIVCTLSKMVDDTTKMVSELSWDISTPDTCHIGRYPTLMGDKP